MNKEIGKYLTDDTCVFEQQPLNRLAAERQIAAFIHPGFWQCMDTYREQQLLTNLWNSGKAPWKITAMTIPTAGETKLFNGYYQGRRVLVTGHTGFKGGWISLWLKKLGASVWGVSLPPPTHPNLHEVIQASAFAGEMECDIRNFRGR